MTTSGLQKYNEITGSRDELKKKAEAARLERIKAAILATSGTAVSGGMALTPVAAQLRGLKRIETEPSEDDTPKLLEEIVKEGLSELSVTTLATLMEDEDTPAAVRSSVAKYVLDRILGKPTQREEIKVETTEKKINITFTVPPQSRAMLDQVVCDEETIIDV